jgi:hypothetical protein
MLQKVRQRNKNAFISTVSRHQYDIHDHEINKMTIAFKHISLKW